MEQNKLKTCINNIYYLAEKNGLKIKDIEKEASLSNGYLSKIKKKSSNISDFSLIKLDKISCLLNVTIDLLLNEELNSINPNDLYVINFLEQLINDTQKGKITWIQRKIEEAILIDTRRRENNNIFAIDGLTPNLFHSIIENKNYIDANKIYMFEIEPTKFIYLFKVQESKVSYFYELYMYDNAKCNIFPISSSHHNNITLLEYYFSSLCDVIEKNVKIPKIEKEVKSVIDSFMNKLN